LHVRAVPDPKRRDEDDGKMTAEVLRRFRHGEPDALALVYRQNIDRVERLVRNGLARAGRLSPDNLADVVQDVFLKAFSRAPRASYDGGRAYGPYILAIARNVLLDWMARTGREIPMSDVVHLTVEELSDDSELQERHGQELPLESEAVVARYVGALPAELRAVHHQRFVIAESQRRAAQVLGISRQELRTREKKIIAGLRHALRPGAKHAPR
jgi:RNA polymerase sigma-70 factor (ECF subfamily)